LILVVLGAHRFYFVTLPQRAIKKFRKTDPERLKRQLMRTVATPSLLGGCYKLVAHNALADICFSRGQHAEAIVHCCAYLKILTGSRNAASSAALEGHIRCRLADCLEAIGQVDEAAEERSRAKMAVDRSPDEPLRYTTQGILLKRQSRYAEA
jgi:tetratricopeptide (TPR) repeat protein